MNRSLLTVSSLALFLLAPGTTADLNRDLEIESELGKAESANGELVRLNAGNTTFAALHLTAQRRPIRGAVILLHDAWGNLDNPKVTRPLRHGLAQAGWETLALQLPTAYAGENAERSVARNQSIGERIDTARQWLQTRDLSEPVLLAAGTSGTLALPYAASREPGELRALVLISSRSTIDSEQRQTLARLGLPILDLVAEFDRDVVLDRAASRRQAMSIEPDKVLHSRRLAGARPDFGDNSDGLVAEIRAWLATYATKGR